MVLVWRMLKKSTAAIHHFILAVCPVFGFAEKGYDYIEEKEIFARFSLLDFLKERNCTKDRESIEASSNQI